MKNKIRLIITSTVSALISIAVIIGVGLVDCGGGGASRGGGGGGSGELSYADCTSGEITTWGEAPIFTSKDAARDKAKKNACLKAIQKCIGEQVAKDSGVSDGQSIANEIFSKTRGICKNDKIVDEQNYKLDTVNMLKVFVRFSVSRVDVKEAIDTAQKMAGNPKVMVLIREDFNLPEGKKVNGFTSPNARASAALQEFLIGKGYDVISPDKARIRSSDEAALAEDPTSGNLEDVFNNLKDQALKAGADVLIIGEIEVNTQDISTLRGSDFKSLKATGNVRLIALWGRGKQLGVFTKQQGGVGTTYLAAALNAAHRYAVGSKKKWKKDPGRLAAFTQKTLKNEWARITKANQIILNIRGMSTVEAGLFRDDLKERTAVKEINEQSQSGDRVVWEVVYPGRSFALADTIGYYGDNPAMFVVVQKTCRKIKVDGVKRGEINLVFEEVKSDQKYRCVPPEKL